MNITKSPRPGSKHDRMLDLWMTGLITPVIAKELGWSSRTVRRALTAYRKIGEPRAVRRPMGCTKKGEQWNPRHPVATSL